MPLCLSAKLIKKIVKTILVTKRISCIISSFSSPLSLLLFHLFYQCTSVIFPYLFKHAYLHKHSSHFYHFSPLISFLAFQQSSTSAPTILKGWSSLPEVTWTAPGLCLLCIMGSWSCSWSTAQSAESPAADPLSATASGERSAVCQH